MKRVLLSFFCCVLALVAFVVPVLGAELAGGYYITGDCALGSGLTFYVPADYATGSLTYDENGYLFNLTSGSIYLYSPDYPDYTIYANRFSGFQYRSSSGSSYQYVDLNLTNVTTTNVEIFTESPPVDISVSLLLVALLVSLLALAGILIVRR